RHAAARLDLGGARVAIRDAAEVDEVGLGPRGAAGARRPLQTRRLLPPQVEAAVLVPTIEPVERAVAEKAAAVPGAELRVLPLVVQVRLGIERRDVVVVDRVGGADAEQRDVVVVRLADADDRRERPPGLVVRRRRARPEAL